VDISVWILGAWVGCVIALLINRWFLCARRAQTAAAQGHPAVEPNWVDWARTAWPMLLIVFVLRGFIVEPFRIPSGSMIPTTNVGDYILVNKFAYGLRWPGLNARMLGHASPQRGDVVVFRFPGYACETVPGHWVRSGDVTCQNLRQSVPSEDWIKRVIGVPGDRITFQNDQLTINGQPVIAKIQGPYVGNRNVADDRYLLDHQATVWTETLPSGRGPVVHDLVRLIGGVPAPAVPNAQWPTVVPPGCYLVMGDDRGDSLDSRWWGCVPDRNLLGRAFVVVLSFPGTGGLDVRRMGHRVQ
jgi:signal peptidase I